MFKLLLLWNFLIFIIIGLLHIPALKKQKKGFSKTSISCPQSKEKLHVDYRSALKSLKTSVLDESDKQGYKYDHSQYFQTTPTSMLNTLIDHYLRLSKKHEIEFTMSICPSLNDDHIADYHLIHIVGNLLQNAFEAVELNRNLIKPVIELNIKCIDDTLTLHIGNSYPVSKCTTADFSKWIQSGYSEKAESGRGYGLSLVQKLISEKDGVFYFDNSKGIEFIIEFSI